MICVYFVGCHKPPLVHVDVRIRDIGIDVLYSHGTKLNLDRCGGVKSILQQYTIPCNKK